MPSLQPLERQRTFFAIFTAASITGATTVRSPTALGASSTTFWYRRCIEHSLSHKCVTLPWQSPTICISTCRNPSTAAFSANTCLVGLSSMALVASLCRSSKWRINRMPRPPPPSTALTMTGKPTLSANTLTASILPVGSVRAGSTGTSHSTASRRASSLSPVRFSTSLPGPTT